MEQHTPLLVSIAGPTAVGKTSLGVLLAKHFHTEVLSVDSRQLYREMTIGTAKPSEVEMDGIRHRFVDHLSIDQPYTAVDFEKEAIDLLKKLFQKNRIVLAVGGSGLFFKALWEGFDTIPEIEPGWREELNQQFQKEGLEVLAGELSEKDPLYFRQVDIQNPQRVIRALEVIRATGIPFSSFRTKLVKERPFRMLKIGLELDRETLYARIDQRMDEMINLGLFSEAEGFYPYRDRNALRTVGYQEIFDFLEGKYDREETIRLLKRNSRRYAKRQLTWFKRDPEIEWFSPMEVEKIIERIEKELV